MNEKILGYIRLMLDFKIKYGTNDVWWRGESDFDNPLLPSVYRDDRLEIEHNSHFRFMRKAVSLHPKTPAKSDYLEWLFLMQHYGLPTRLLDWSESMLVALYFSSNEISKQNKDGVLYALLPSKLNFLEVEKEALILPHDGTVQKIAQEAFSEVKNDPKKIVAILPTLIDVRQAIQQSVFTIHGKRDPLGGESFIDKCIFKFRVDKNDKAGVLEMVKMLGLNRSALFPDLDNLSQEIKELKYVST